mmetsp:Transcript_2016/g.7400  ORF Transcript_2016/g.7400 Transcript_2016/m.7400 type:complete len:247 (+) Transcript_2016:287-1027(+)
MREHATEHLSRNPNAGYVQWLADLHPENVSIDPRLMSEENEWRKVWLEATSQAPEEEARRAAVAETSTAAAAADAVAAAPRQYSGLLDLSVGIALALSSVAVAFAFELVRAVGLVGSGLAWRALAVGPACLPARVWHVTFGPVLLVFYFAFRLIALSTHVGAVVATEALGVGSFVVVTVLALSWAVGVQTRGRLCRSSRGVRRAMVRVHGGHATLLDALRGAASRPGGSDDAYSSLPGSEQEAETV